MRSDAPSSTAALVAGTLSILSRDSRLTTLAGVQDQALLERMLSGAPGDFLRRTIRQSAVLRRLFLSALDATTPGISAHYAARKQWIGRRVREALNGGVEQLVVVGAGFDLLASDIVREFPGVRCFELDHPATQELKKRAIRPDEESRLHFIPLDLEHHLPGEVLREHGGFDSSRHAVCVAEGLTMYLPEERVRALLTDLSEVAGDEEDSRVIFTFMERDEAGRIQFEGQSGIVKQWLKWKGEPFRWGERRGSLKGFLHECRLRVEEIAGADELRKSVLEPLGLEEVALANGEHLCTCRPVAKAEGVWCNDIHSRLNPAKVASIRKPRTTEATATIVKEARRAEVQISICGGRHAMGGQQFGSRTELLDMRRLNGVGEIDHEKGTVEAGAGIQWRELIEALHQQQLASHGEVIWSIRQKQTGADALTLGGALAANIHGRGLEMAPFISDVEAFTLVTGEGEMLRCSREENSDWFRWAAGGYGCFGVVTSICLRLTKREILMRRVEVIDVNELLPAIDRQVADGAMYGDFQFSIDDRSGDFLHRGILSTYHRTGRQGDLPPAEKALSKADWARLIRLAHTDPGTAFRDYRNFYLSTDRALYWSDLHQLTVYLDHYHEEIDAECGNGCTASEMITELYVPRPALPGFMAAAAAMLRERQAKVIYGTIRMIEEDRESFLPWASGRFACVIFNLHIEHEAAALEHAAETFRQLLDLALERDGSFYLTYHRWARRDQIERAYPRFREFLSQKERRDPRLMFQSDWWRHHRELFREDAVEPEPVQEILAQTSS